MGMVRKVGNKTAKHTENTGGSIWKRILLLGMSAVFLLSYGNVRVHAAKKGQTVQMDFSDMVGSTDDIAGGTITPTLAYAEEIDLLRLRFQTIGYPERYYTATAFKNVDMELEGYQGIEFHVENHQDTPVRMNFAFSLENGKTAAAGNGYYVRLKSTESDYAKVEYGCFDLPGKFNGTVEIPFDVLKYQELSVNEVSVDRIWGYGFICVVEAGERFDVTLSGLKLLTPQETTGADTPGMLMIMGDERALRSSIGESQTKYRCEVYNMLGESEETEAEFFMGNAFGTEEGGNGGEARAWISTDGILTVDYRCDADVLEIGARTADGRVAYKQVELYESWTNITSTESGYNASIARPEQIAPVVTNMDILQHPTLLWRVREILLGAAAIFMLWYLMLRRKSRRGR